LNLGALAKGKGYAFCRKDILGTEGCEGLNPAFLLDEEFFDAGDLFICEVVDFAVEVESGEVEVFNRVVANTYFKRWVFEDIMPCTGEFALFKVSGVDAKAKNIDHVGDGIFVIWVEGVACEKWVDFINEI